MYEDIPVCEHSDNAVKAFAADIFAEAQAYTDYEGDFDIEYIPWLNKRKTKQAASATITSEIGVIIIFPNFKKKTANASILNLGKINAMQLEGYDQDYIEKHGNVYGVLIPKSDSAVKMFGHYLTHRIREYGKI